MSKATSNPMSEADKLRAAIAAMEGYAAEWHETRRKADKWISFWGERISKLTAELTALKQSPLAPPRRMETKEITWRSGAMAERESLTASYGEMLSDVATMIATDAGRSRVEAVDVANAALRAIQGSPAAEQWNVMVERARLRMERDALLAACEAALHAIENADLGGEVLWVRPPHQAAAVHETASERLADAIRLAKEGANA